MSLVIEFPLKFIEVAPNCVAQDFGKLCLQNITKNSFPGGAEQEVPFT